MESKEMCNKLGQELKPVCYQHFTRSSCVVERQRNIIINCYNTSNTTIICRASPSPKVMVSDPIFEKT